MNPTVAAIIPAAGSGTRMKLDQPKQYQQLAGTPLIVHTVRAFFDHRRITTTVVVVPVAWLERTREMLADHGLEGDRLIVMAGGRRRQDSVLAGISVLAEETDIVLVHDGARPLISDALIERMITAASDHGAAIAAVPVKDTLKRAGTGNCIADTVDRTGLWQAQTPQAARLPLLRAGFQATGEEDVTDEAMLLEKAGIPVMLVEGDETNLKITHPRDLDLAEDIMQQHAVPTLRIGHGFDAHRLVENRDLVLGGVTVPYELGLAGHSDADVVTHALCDALLGALGLGDIGRHFPDSDDAFAGIYSIKLLEHTMELVAERRMRIANIDITVVCQRPRLSAHLPAMRETLATACRAPAELINLKATTTEKMGYTGRGEGISCHAVVLLTT